MWLPKAPKQIWNSEKSIGIAQVQRIDPTSPEGIEQGLRDAKAQSRMNHQLNMTSNARKDTLCEENRQARKRAKLESERVLAAPTWTARELIRLNGPVELHLGGKRGQATSALDHNSADESELKKSNELWSEDEAEDKIRNVGALLYPTELEAELVEVENANVHRGPAVETTN